MGSATPAHALIVDAQARAAGRVHGTGGWHPPEERGALDWVTLMQLCGWRARMVHTDEAQSVHAASTLRWIVVATAPESLSAQAALRLEAIAREHPVLVVGSAARAGTPWARLSGVTREGGERHLRSVEWCGPGESAAWHCRAGFHACDVRTEAGVQRWASGDERALVLARSLGRGAIVTLGFDASRARDADGAATALLRHTLIYGSRAPVAWFDWTGTLVLRMDDPGSAQSVHSRTWRYPKLTAPQWSEVGDALAARQGRLTIAYVPGWVDDGDASRGALSLNGTAARRVPGAVYPSSEVSYVDTSKAAPCATSDYRDEHAGIQALRSRGVAEVELHGHTHVHPDRAAWLAAPDRYESSAWYRELGAGAASAIAAARCDAHPLALGAALLRSQFGVAPAALVCPGDEWTDAALERALDLGVQLVSSYYLALRQSDDLYWSTHVCAPYLDQADAAWFDAGLPVVGYFHDREPSLFGVEWFARCLERWSAAGATRWIDLRELASATSRALYASGSANDVSVLVCEPGAPAVPRSLPVRVYAPR